MTPYEKRLAAILLETASDQFSNHGCNEFPRPENVRPEEWEQLKRDIAEWNGTPDEIYEPHDYAVMSYLAAVLTDEAEEP